MKILRATLAGIIVSLLSLIGRAQAEEFTFEVYRDEQVVVSAGVVNLENRIVHFGEMLSLVVNVAYNPGTVRLQEMDTDFFISVWPDKMGPYLLDYQTSPQPEPGATIHESRSVYRFQVLACPDGKILCKGSRFYELPEFALEYQIIDEAGNEVSAETVQFRPWPTTIMIATAIPLGEEGELNPFATYFPTGAYPNLLSGEDFRYLSAGMVAGGLFLFLGGILMSPFSFLKRKAFAAKEVSRWEVVLKDIQSGAIKDEDKYLDALRKCLVWYCVDTLKVDPFNWIKHEEEVSERPKGTDDFAEFKTLFIDLLHSPRGQRDALLGRLTSLVAHAH